MNTLKNLSLKKFGLLISAMLVAASIAVLSVSVSMYSNVSQIKDKVESYKSQIVKKDQIIGEITFKVGYGLVKSVKDFFNYKRAKYIIEGHRQIRDITVLLTHYDTLRTTDTEKQVIATIEEAISNYSIDIEEAERSLHSNKGLSKFLKLISLEDQKISHAIQRLNAILEKERGKSTADIESRIEQVHTFTGVGLSLLALLIISISGAAFAFIYFKLIEPLEKISKSIMNLSLGNLFVKMDALKGRKDEVGMIARAVIKLKESIVTKNEMMEENAMMSIELREAQKMKSLGVLARGIAHEINTPLQFVKDNNKFLQDAFEELRDLIIEYEGLLEKATDIPELEAKAKQLKVLIQTIDIEDLDNEVKDSITQANQGIEEVASIIKSMKRFADSPEGERQSGDLNKTISDILFVSKNEWEDVADVKVDFCKELPSVPFIPTDFNQTILNIITNSADAIRESNSQNKGVIAVKTDFKDSIAIVSITDNGIGMEKEVKGKVFEPFFTTKAPGQGTGQGLSAAYNTIVNKHKGKIYCSSVLGKGTTFVIELPLETDQEATKEDSTEEMENEDQRTVC